MTDIKPELPIVNNSETRQISPKLSDQEVVEKMKKLNELSEELKIRLTRYKK